MPERKGWLKIPGQYGDRTLEEQMVAVWPAVEVCAGKTVVDLGCAEGLIGYEFAKAGAAKVLGVDSVLGHIEVARRLCTGYPIEFEQVDLRKVDPDKPLSFDIVLALGVIHKLTFPDRGLRFAARSARDLLLMRSGRGMQTGIIRGKHSGNTCDAYAILKEENFILEKTVTGPASHGEDVEYYRRAA